jgi:hypothetical protein
VFREQTIISIAGNTVHNLRAFIRGKAISLLILRGGRSQFPNPAPRTGITTKNTIIKA